MCLLNTATGSLYRGGEGTKPLLSALGEWVNAGTRASIKDLM